MINIKETFLKLTSKTYPYGNEYLLIELLSEYNFKEDSHGNFFIIVPKPNGDISDTMFTCHLDTYYRNIRIHTYVEDPVKVTHEFEGDFITSDNTTILGADDKAGMVILLNMISEKVPGLYYFFIGEEVGRFGSGDLSKNFDIFLSSNEIPKINKCISFDRKGYDSITTKQFSKRCCSDEFATDLLTKINEYGFWYEHTNGGRTDSHEFIGIIPECTNLSVGYFGEHTVFEKQDIEFLEMLSITLTQIDWDSLVVKGIESYVDVVKPVYTKPHNMYPNTNRYNLDKINIDDIDEHHFNDWYNLQTNLL